MGPFPVNTKFYYLYKSVVKDGKAVKGIPAITVCIGKDMDGRFYRGVSIASDYETRDITKKEGRNRARGRMIRALRRGNGKFMDANGKEYDPKIHYGSAMNVIEHVLHTGIRSDNPKKYMPHILHQYWAADVSPTYFEKTLFEEAS